MAEVGGEIREGFLCPICITDLGTVSQLHEHFDQAHAAEDKDVLDQLKGLFDKAKRKILGQDREDDSLLEYQSASVQGDSAASSVGLVGIDPRVWDPQDLGVVRSHTDLVKRHRDRRIDRFVVETNKLLIRLDKLISPDAPNEPNKRKAYEKGIAPWAPDADVKICTACGKSFGITRRRHHCRLCGTIVCNKCSHFLPFSYAKKLTNPAFHHDGEGFHRSSSTSSLNSMLSPDGELQVRTCEQCRALLERRDQQVEQRNSRPLITQLYQKMRIYLDEAERLLPQYLEMAEALFTGETTYSLQSTRALRLKIIKLYEGIDTLSKRIGSLGLADPEPPTGRQLQLQRSVRLQVTDYLKCNMMGLQGLPTEEDLEKLQEYRREETERRIQEEKRAAAERERQRQEELRKQDSILRVSQKASTTSTSSNSSLHSPPETVTTSAGWKPMEVKKVMANAAVDDPMVQQMNIIRSYVKQAREAQKWDEVQMLEDNLRELQLEYWRQEEPKKATADATS